MNNYTILNQVIVIFLIMLIGVYARRRNIIDDKLNKGLTVILLNLTLPLNIIASFNFGFSRDMLMDMLIVFIFGILIHLISYMLGKLLFKKYLLDIKNVMIFGAVFSNCGFMAFPILEGLYGKVGVLYGSIFLAPFNIYLWTLGVMLFKTQKYEWNFKNIVNPGIVAVVIGLFMFIFSIKLPFPVQRSFEMIGAMTTPISMMITGVIIGEMKISRIFTSLSVYYLSIVRLVLIPFLTALVLHYLGVKDIVYGICVLISAMPVAAMATVFAERFEGNSLLASQAVFITTVLSLFTIPLIALILL